MLWCIDIVAHRLHSCKGGHAMDMAQFGQRLSDILRAGDWRSAAFAAYLDQSELETQVSDSAVASVLFESTYVGSARDKHGRKRRRDCGLSTCRP